MFDALIVGGGVIGLSLARELSSHGLKVAVADRAAPGREASWAGAGMLPPTAGADACAALQQLHALSLRLQPEWSAALREETGLDDGFRRCGAWYLADDDALAEELAQLTTAWQAGSVAFTASDAQDLAAREPELASGPALRRLRAAYFTPDECQIRNPWRLRALLASLNRRHAVIMADRPIVGWQTAGSRVLAAMTPTGPIAANQYVIAGGAWSRELAAQLGCETPLKPIRGQIVLLKYPAGRLPRIVNVGSRYLTPREDGHVLLGSTEEDAGFDKRNTAGAVTELLDFAAAWAPGLRAASFERCWAGLRPATADRAPVIGRATDWDNLYLATGHFRAGLTLSPGTAVALGAMVCGNPAPIELAELSPARFAARSHDA